MIPSPEEEQCPKHLIFQNTESQSFVTYTDIQTHMLIHTYTGIDTHNMYTHVHAHRLSHTYTHMCIHTCMGMHVQTHTHAHATGTHTCAYSIPFLSCLASQFLSSPLPALSRSSGDVTQLQGYREEVEAALFLSRSKVVPSDSNGP